MSRERKTLLAPQEEYFVFSLANAHSDLCFEIGKEKCSNPLDFSITFVLSPIAKQIVFRFS